MHTLRSHHSWSGPPPGLKVYRYPQHLSHHQIHRVLLLPEWTSELRVSSESMSFLASRLAVHRACFSAFRGALMGSKTVRLAVKEWGTASFALGQKHTRLFHQLATSHHDAAPHGAPLQKHIQFPSWENKTSIFKRVFSSAWLLLIFDSRRRSQATQFRAARHTDNKSVHSLTLSIY